MTTQIRWRIRVFLLLQLIIAISMSACNGDSVAVYPRIADVSTPTARDAWIVTDDARLLHIKSSGEVVEETLCKSKLVAFVNQSTGWILCDDGQLWNTVDGQTWQPTGTIPSSTALHASGLAFADEKVGWMTTSFGLWLTTDGGATWSNVNVGKQVAQPVDFYPIDSELGWLLATGGKVFRTNDRGRNWTATDVGTNTSIRAFYADGKENTWAGGATGPGGLFRFDASGNWNQVLDVTQRNGIGIFSISFSTRQHGWLAGLSFAKLDPETPPSGVIMRTFDSGKTWTKIDAAPPDKRFIHIKFFDESAGWLVSSDRVYHSTDGGDNWARLTDLRRSP